VVATMYREGIVLLYLTFYNKHILMNIAAIDIVTTGARLMSWQSCHVSSTWWVQILIVEKFLIAQKIK